MGRRWGDRRDGELIRNIDSIHFIMPNIYPGRCDNEAFISETLDLTNVNKYLEEKNASGPVYKYNLFQVLVTAMVKTITLRPKMNRFIANKNYYQRNEVSASFVVKKEFADHGAEALAFLHTVPSDNIDAIHQKIYDEVSSCRSEKVDASTGAMDVFNKMPRWFSKFLIKIFCWIEKHGWVPQSLIATDPYYASVIISNLGSIKLHAGYHHLTNWGTTSIFLVIGERKMRPFYNDDGTFEMKDSVDLGLTVDERIGDGYYFSKTVKLLKKLIENPELLETQLDCEVEY